MKYNIWRDCPKKPITELLSFIVDNRGKTVPTTKDGYKLIATNCVTNRTLFPTYEKIRYLSEETYQTWFRAHPMPGDILFVNKGTPGRVCMVPDPVDFCIAQDMIALRADNKKIYNKYLFAVLRSPIIQQQIYNTNVGDVIPHFKKQFLDQLLIPIPERSIQEFIGNFYYNISYKIELNQQINNNLEQQIDLIYQSFFAEDMERVELGKAIETTSGGTPSRKNLAFYENADIPWVKSKELSGNFITDTEEKINQLALNKSSAKLLPSHSVLVAMYGATVGEYGIITTEMACNQAICGLLENCDYPFTYLFEFVKHFQEVLKSRAIGSAQQNISQLVIKQLMVHSNTDKIKKYHKIVLPLFQKMELLCKENARLTDIRDCLLPKLMSGEISFGGNES